MKSAREVGGFGAIAQHLMRLHPYAKGAVWFAETFLWFSTTAVDLAASPEEELKLVL
ncbi:hypothetical protein [Bacillus sp. JCM 19041]|uniref:hypothetical protein n=1 Tax=Bacillus sp. JCM 19041 TaxID=1460637 RepID=UPI000A9C0D05